jgi:hypothetical protein
MLRDTLPLLIGESDAAAAAAFAVDLARDWPGLQGVIGAPAGCEAFAGKWKDLTGRGHRLRVRMRQHALPQSATFYRHRAARGRPRPPIRIG